MTSNLIQKLYPSSLVHNPVHHLMISSKQEYVPFNAGSVCLCPNK